MGQKISGEKVKEERKFESKAEVFFLGLRRTNKTLSTFVDFASNLKNTKETAATPQRAHFNSLAQK